MTANIEFIKSICYLLYLLLLESLLFMVNCDNDLKFADIGDTETNGYLDHLGQGGKDRGR